MHSDLVCKINISLRLKGADLIPDLKIILKGICYKNIDYSPGSAACSDSHKHSKHQLGMGV